MLTYYFASQANLKQSRITGNESDTHQLTLDVCIEQKTQTLSENKLQV